MPFVTQDHRLKPNLSLPGDRCFQWYNWMMGEWRKERKWTTADRIYAYVIECHKKKILPDESKRALDLAWQVFFVMEVIPYEEEKKEENGEI